MAEHDTDRTVVLDDAFWSRVGDEIAGRMVFANEHPTLPLKLYCYTRGAQFDNHWNDVTETCRGLIVDDDRNVIARPMRKFHQWKDLTEHERPTGPFAVTEKVDGSMVTVARYDGQVICATKGGFGSEQAIAAAELLDARYDTDAIVDGLTYTFEFIHPANQIVVDYGDTIEMVLLAVRDTATGDELDLDDVDDIAGRIGCRAARRYELDEMDPDTLAGLGWDNAEGFVLRFADATRVKVKFPEYVQLHALMTTVPTARRVWEASRRGVLVDELLDNMPDEYDGWVREQHSQLHAGIDALEAAVADVADTLQVDELYEREGRKAVAKLAHSPAFAAAVPDGFDLKAVRGLLLSHVLDQHPIDRNMRDRYSLPYKSARSLWDYVKPPADVYPPGNDLLEGISHDNPKLDVSSAESSGDAGEPGQAA